MKVGEVRAIVWARDEGCIAQRVDPDAGPCYDRWGTLLPLGGRWTPGDVEMDYVRLGAHGQHHELPQDHVMVCPGHHRGAGPSAGYQWATAHRPDERAYLEAQDEQR